jgi:signal transduction histidine kinase
MTSNVSNVPGWKSERVPPDHTYLKKMVACTSDAAGKEVSLTWENEDGKYCLSVKQDKKGLSWRLDLQKADKPAAELWTIQTTDLNILSKRIIYTVNSVSARKTGREPVIADLEWVGNLIKPHKVNAASGKDPEDGSIHPKAQELSRAFYAHIAAYAGKMNALTKQPSLQVTSTDFGEVRETKPDSADTVSIHRWRAATGSWSLSARAQGARLELYLVPSTEQFLFLRGADEHRLKMRIALCEAAGQEYWAIDGVPVDTDEVRLLARTCFQDLVRATKKFNEQTTTGNWQFALDMHSLPGAHFQQMLIEKQNLAQKIVSQQEEIQGRIARDLHDAVISDVTALKRGLAGDAKLSKDEIMESLDHITARLREICYELSPSDLSDWGLTTTLEALVEQVSRRTQAECAFYCNAEMPKLEPSVELHIFRIVQECLNNSAKHSAANHVTLTVDYEDSELIFTVRDDGKGFDPAEVGARHATAAGGIGMSSMRERTELIRIFYKADISIKSEPRGGTTSALKIRLGKKQ